MGPMKSVGECSMAGKSRVLKVFFKNVKSGKVKNLVSLGFKFSIFFLQCFDAVGWAAGKASGL